MLDGSFKDFYNFSSSFQSIIVLVFLGSFSLKGVKRFSSLFLVVIIKIMLIITSSLFVFVREVFFLEHFLFYLCMRAIIDLMLSWSTNETSVNYWITLVASILVALFIGLFSKFLGLLYSNFIDWNVFFPYNLLLGFFKFQWDLSLVCLVLWNCYIPSLPFLDQLIFLILQVVQAIFSGC